MIDITDITNKHVSSRRDSDNIDATFRHGTRTIYSLYSQDDIVPSHSHKGLNLFEQ